MQMIGTRIFATLVLQLFMLLPAWAQMPKIELGIGMYRIDAEVAHTEAMRQKGLMHRMEMAQQQGMLFVFPEAQPYCMWMRNTFIPLSVAFLDDAGRILNIEDMAPQTESNHCAVKPARYALEMNKGWFAARNLKPGQLLRGLDKAPPAR